MGDFKTEIGLEVVNLQFVNGYNSSERAIPMADCISGNGTVFDNGVWRVQLGSSVESESNSNANISIANDTFRRGLNQRSGLLLLGARSGRLSTRFIPNTKFDELECADLVEDTVPDGEYDFEFNLADDRYTVLVSDGTVIGHPYKVSGYRQHVRYEVVGANWVAYCTSRGKNEGRERTVITELDGRFVQELINEFLDEHGATDLADLLEIWSDIVDFDDEIL